MKRNAPCLLVCALLCACTPQKMQQERADAARYRAQLQERDVSEKCAAIADPGSPQHLACMLSAEKSAPAK